MLVQNASYLYIIWDSLETFGWCNMSWWCRFGQKWSCSVQTQSWAYRQQSDEGLIAVTHTFTKDVSDPVALTEQTAGQMCYWSSSMVEGDALHLLCLHPHKDLGHCDGLELKHTLPPHPPLHAAPSCAGGIGSFPLETMCCQTSNELNHIFCEWKNAATEETTDIHSILHINPSRWFHSCIFDRDKVQLLSLLWWWRSTPAEGLLHRIKSFNFRCTITWLKWGSFAHVCLKNSFLTAAFTHFWFRCNHSYNQEDVFRPCPRSLNYSRHS